MENDNRPTTILIIDDHPVFRRGLAGLINNEQDLEVCAEAADFAEALHLISTLNPECCIVDISLVDANGLQLIKRVRNDNYKGKILVASMHSENQYAERAVRAGANGFISKQEAPENMIKAIRTILAGKIYVSEAIAERILERHLCGNNDNFSDRPEDILSNREIEIFSLIGKGLTTKLIADSLHISPKTVDTHRDNIKRKLGLNNNNELIRNAVEQMGS